MIFSQGSVSYEWMEDASLPTGWKIKRGINCTYYLRWPATGYKLLVSIWTWLTIIAQPNRWKAVHWEKDCSSIHDPGIANHRWTNCAGQNSCCPVWYISDDIFHGTVIDCRWQFFVPMSHVLSLQYGQLKNLNISIFWYFDIYSTTIQMQKGKRWGCFCVSRVILYPNDVF